MNVQIENLSTVRRRIRFTIPAEAVNAAFVSTTAKISAKARIPGFRPGKAPSAMIERQFGVEVRRDVLDRLLQGNVFTAIEEAGVRAVGRPEVESFSDLKRGEAMQVAVVVEVLPEIELTGYEGAELIADEVYADEHDLENALEEKARGRAEWVPVEDGAQPGDEIVVDYVLTPQGEGEPVSAERRRFTIGDGRAPAQVDEAVLGSKPGDHIEKEVAVEAGDVMFGTVPAVAIDVTVHEVQRQEIPKLDDELAKDLGLPDLDALRAQVQAALDRQVTEANRELRRKVAVDNLLAVNPIEVPSSVTDAFVDEQLERTFGRMAQRDLKGIEDIIKRLRKDLTRDAEAAMRRSLALGEVAKQAKVEASHDEVEARIEDMGAREPLRKDAIRKHYAALDAREELRRRLVNEKAMDHLVAASQWTVGTRKALHQGQDGGPDDEHADHDHAGHDHDHAGHDHADHDHDHDHAGHDHEGHDHA